MFQFVLGLFAIGTALASIYAPFRLPAPFEHVTIAQRPFIGELAPLEGPLRANTRLQYSQRLFENEVVSPETVVFDTQGRLCMFTEKGIYRANPQGDSYGDLELFLEVPGGRPLSGAFDSHGALYFCDSMQGLGRVEIESMELKYVLSSSDLSFCDDLVISSKDEIFIADATSVRVPAADLVVRTSYAAVSSGIGDGRLLKYTPSTGTLETLITNITFANGVELTHDESAVLASDGGSAFRTLRYWLTGPRAGTWDVFIESLPGYSDGINRGSAGTYWISIYARTDLAQLIILHSRLLRWAGSLLPVDIQERIITRHGIVIQVSGEGEILRSFHDAGGVYGRTTSCLEKNGRLYVGGFFPFLRILDLNETATQAPA